MVTNKSLYLDGRCESRHIQEFGLNFWLPITAWQGNPSKQRNPMRGGALLYLGCKKRQTSITAPLSHHGISALSLSFLADGSALAPVQYSPPHPSLEVWAAPVVDTPSFCNSARHGKGWAWPRRGGSPQGHREGRKQSPEQTSSLCVFSGVGCRWTYPPHEKKQDGGCQEICPM